MGETNSTLQNGRRPIVDSASSSGTPETNRVNQENRLSACLPLVGPATDQAYIEFQVLNSIKPTSQREQQDKTQNQNRPKMENQNTNGPPQGLPLVGIGSPETHRKEPRRTVPRRTRFHDHLVLESKPLFMIILRLENAPGSQGKAGGAYAFSGFRGSTAATAPCEAVKNR
jgi:hypothetical protein